MKLIRKRNGPWSVGRPAKRGWYWTPTHINQRLDDPKIMVRWWTGTRWSVAVHRLHTPEYAAYLATMLARHDFLPYWAEITPLPGSPAYINAGTVETLESQPKHVFKLIPASPRHAAPAKPTETQDGKQS